VAQDGAIEPVSSASGGKEEPPKAKLSARVKSRVESSRERLEAERQRRHSVDATIRVVERDRSAGGSLLAGAIAFRIFSVLVPFSLVLVALMGAVSTYDAGTPGDAARSFGLAGATANSISSVSSDSKGTWWIAMLVGGGALLWSAGSATKVLKGAHALAWGIPLSALRTRVHERFVLVGFGFLVVAISVTLAWVRTVKPLGIVLVLALGMAAWSLFWLAAAILLPHGPVPWWRLIPGAILFGAGIEALHVVTIVYFAPKVDSASQTYGQLGVALALLGWLFVLSRLIVATAMLNSTLAERSQAHSSDHERESLHDPAAEIDIPGKRHQAAS
jgi:uncharacterized BrkB/YihY/UPF0761 family membrane protein